jgi:DNA-binding HxlR family transcriptional regulator
MRPPVPELEVVKALPTGRKFTFSSVTNLHAKMSKSSFSARISTMVHDGLVTRTLNKQTKVASFFIEAETKAMIIKRLEQPGLIVKTEAQDLHNMFMRV